MRRSIWVRQIIFLLSISFIIIVLQQTVFNFRFFDGRKPELFTILIIDYAFSEENKYRGYFFSSVVGFFEDILTNQIFGVNIFLKSAIFLLIFLLKDKIFFNNLFFKSVSSVSVHFLEVIFIYILSVVFVFSALNPFGSGILGYFSIYLVVSPLFIIFIDKIYGKFVAVDES